MRDLFNPFFCFIDSVIRANSSSAKKIIMTNPVLSSEQKIIQYLQDERQHLHHQKCNSEWYRSNQVQVNQIYPVEYSSNVFSIQIHYSICFVLFSRHFAEDVTRHISYVCDVNPYREGNLCFTRPLTGKTWHGEFFHRGAE